MEITTTEKVTRTYCDVCGIDITHKSQCGTSTPKFDYVVCMETRFDIDLTPAKGVRLNCEMLAKLYTEYPELANQQFSEVLESEIFIPKD